MYPKIELHVHLEATVKPERLLEIAKRNGSALPATTVEELASLYRYRDFDHFIEIWTLTTNALSSYDDFRQIVVDYAQEAARHGAVYIEGIFSPIERAWRGVDWDEMFAGYCDGAQQAREAQGVEVRLTPDITRGAPLEDAFTAVRYAAKYRERGIVGVGLGGEENLYPPEPFAPAFARARAEGLSSVPHAGEVVGVQSVRGALEALAADRIRHGIRAIDDPGLVREIAGRELVLDVCPISNLPNRRRPVAFQAPVAEAGHPGRQVLDLDGRSGDVRHRSHARLRGRDVTRPLSARVLRGRRRRGAVRCRHQSAVAGDRRCVRLERRGAAREGVLRRATRLELEAEPHAVGFYEKMGARYLRDSEPGAWGRVNPVMGIAPR